MTSFIGLLYLAVLVKERVAEVEKALVHLLLRGGHEIKLWVSTPHLLPVRESWSRGYSHVFPSE